MTRFSDKVTLITGGGGGLGRASALRFAEEKASVAIADVDLERAQAGAAEIGSKAIAIRADVTSINTVRRWSKRRVTASAGWI